MNYKTLIVDDEDIIAKSEKRILDVAFSEIDISIDTVDNENDALEKILFAKDSGKPYDLVITDLNLYDGKAKPQDTSGLDFLKKLSTMPDSPNVMIRSAFPSSVVAKYCLSLGLNGYIETCNIAKRGWTEDNRKELIEAVRNLIKKKQASIKKGRKIEYGRLIYSYDEERWYCDGTYMEKLVFPYDKLLLYFIENNSKVLTVDRIFNYLDYIKANYETGDGIYAKRVSYRINRLREILKYYGFEKDDVICTSKRGGYYAKYVEI